MNSEILMHWHQTIGQTVETPRNTQPLSTVRSRVDAGDKGLIELHADKWTELCDEVQAPPFYRPEWIRVLLECFEPNSRLVLLTTHSDEKLSAILPLTRKRRWFGGVPVVKLSVPANIHSVYFDIPAVAGRREESIAQLWSQLKNIAGWHVTEVPLMPDSGTSRELLARAEEDGYTTLLIPFHESPILRMQADNQGQLNPLAGASRHFRHELRRFARLYREQTGQEPQIVRRDNPDAKILEKFFQLEASGWKGEEQSAINCAEETRAYYSQIANLAAARGYFSLYSLETDKEMIAGAFCVETRNCVFPMKIAYDERLHRTGPGQLLFNGILADCAQRHIPTLFFGGKKNRFKASWTSDTVPFFTGFIFNRGLLPGLAYRSRVSVVTRLGSLRRAVKDRFSRE
jgi:CelD/BcsL family acetyltransferase involved in cellulose biosynthesis